MLTVRIDEVDAPSEPENGHRRFDQAGRIAPIRLYDLPSSPAVSSAGALPAGHRSMNDEVSTRYVEG
jgi:hypothetical protein